MDLELQGKVAIITGGSKGIGKAVALELAREGADVAIAARTLADCEQTAGEIASETGQRAIAISVDTTKSDEVQNMVDKTVAELGKVDILINSAAMVGGQVRGTIAEATEKDMLEDLDTKVVGYFRAMKAVVPHMQAQQWGRIISIGGVSARQCVERQSAAVQIDHIGDREDRHRQLAPLLGQQPALLEHDQGVAHRRPAHLELARQLRLDQRSARTDLARHDAVAQHGVHLLAERRSSDDRCHGLPLGSGGAEGGSGGCGAAYPAYGMRNAKRWTRQR